MTGSAARRGVVRLVLAAVAAVLCWATVPPAAAHDELLFSDPSESGVLRAMPSRAILTFTGPVAEVHEVTVTGPDGSIANGTPTATGPEVRQNLWAGPDGAYTLTYDVVSSDGHEMAGEIRFEVGDGTPDEVGAAASSSSGTTTIPTECSAGSSCRPAWCCCPEPARWSSGTGAALPRAGPSPT